MKLLFCQHCADVFSLPLVEWGSCRCGHVRGRYLADMHSAETNGNGICIAFDNRDLRPAIDRLEATKFEGSYDSYYEDFAFKAWVRPHEGPGNPRSRIVKQELKSDEPSTS